MNDIINPQPGDVYLTRSRLLVTNLRRVDSRYYPFHGELEGVPLSWTTGGRLWSAEESPDDIVHGPIKASDSVRAALASGVPTNEILIRLLACELPKA